MFDLLSGNFTGTFVASNNLVKSFALDEKDMSKNVFNLVGYGYQDQANCIYLSDDMGDSRFSFVDTS